MTETLPGTEAPPSIDRDFCRGKAPMSFAIAALFLWMEEVDDAECVSLSLNVNWRDVSIAHAAAMKEPTKDFLAAAPNRYPPTIFLHKILEKKSEPGEAAAYSPGTPLFRAAAPLTNNVRMQNLLSFLKKEVTGKQNSSPEEKDQPGEVLNTFKDIVALLSSKLKVEEAADGVFSNLCSYLEGCCKVRALVLVNSPSSQVRKKLQKDHKETGMPLWKLLGPLVFDGETNINEDHPLKSVSFSGQAFHGLVLSVHPLLELTVMAHVTPLLFCFTSRCCQGFACVALQQAKIKSGCQT